MPLSKEISDLFHSHVFKMYWDYPSELDMAPH